RDTAASRRQVVGSSRELTLTAIDANARVDECVVDGRVDNASVIQAPAATNTVFAITGNVESKSDAWSKVVSVVDLVVGLRQRRIHVDRIRVELVLVTQTEIQSKSRRHAPVVLDEVVQVGGLHVQAEHTKALVEVSGVALARAPSRANAETKIVVGSSRVAEVWRESTNRAVRGPVSVVDDEVVETIGAGVVELTTEEAQVVDDVLDDVDVAAPLERVIAGGKRDGVSKLPPALIRKRRALEKLGHAERET